jgi:hypothetical protein
MPLLSTFSAGSARALGHFRKGREKTLQTRTFTANGTWVTPLTVVELVSLVGKGGAGSPSSSSTVARGFTLDFVFGTSGSGGANSGALGWSAFSDASGAVSAINGGGSGTILGTTYTGFLGDNTYQISLNTGHYSNAVPGSASASYSAGWKFSGPVINGDNGSAGVSWLEYGGTIPATTGASTTGFGKTFPGGFGGAATPVTYPNGSSPAPIAVTPGASNGFTIQAGGSLTFTWLE